MDYRHLGRSGLKISEIAYGNWITHGSQVEEQAAAACVRAALDLYQAHRYDHETPIEGAWARSSGHRSRKAC
jgi:aryl-alcohol dehydrogenase-like predicted oxidoreductase